MPGAGDQTRQVRVINANWIAGEDGDGGQFELLGEWLASTSAHAANCLIELLVLALRVS
jgi:hypothetical protein